MSYGYKIVKTKNSELLSIPLELVNQAVKSRKGWSSGQQENKFRFQGKIGEFSAHYDDGVIWASRIGGETLEEFISMAKLLDARVSGEEYETYETAEKWYIHPDDQNERSKFDSETLRIASVPKSKPMSLLAQKVWISIIYAMCFYGLVSVWLASVSNFAVWLIRIVFTLVIFPLLTFITYRIWKKG